MTAVQATPARTIDELRTRLRVYAITPERVADPVALSGGDTESADAIVSAVRLAAGAGITAVQYRDKSARSPDERLALARRLAALCRELDLLFVVNDDVDLALACGADAVHLGPEDEAVEHVRERVGDRLWIGASAGVPARAVELVTAGADYLGVGAIFDAHGTKPDASAPRGVEVLRDFRAAPALGSVPIVAIGGITAETAGACVRAGADGVAVTRAILGAPDVALAAAAFARALGRG